MLEIVKYPDPVLRRGGKRVTVFDGGLAETAAQMLAAMYLYRGVGLAAPQVALELDLLVLNPTGEKERAAEEMVLVNPEITSRKKREFGEEGCLSFPGIYAEVERHRDIVVRYQTLAGEPEVLQASEFLARVIQHEMDHLDGVLFVDRLTPADRIRVKPKLLELEQQYGGARAR